MKRTRQQIIVDYHERTKHRFQRYARSAGYMDWANQPNPFRFYEGGDILALPFADPPPDPRHADLFMPVAQPPAALDLAGIGRFFEYALGLSAWKAAGSARWSLRMNPSSGNLHPTECHLVLPPLSGRPGGAICHYNPFRHALEQRAAVPAAWWPQLAAHFGTDGFLVALTSIFWRESWKYGERAYRYCQLDVGHALAALAFSARLNQWRLHALTGVTDGHIRQLLGFERLAWPPQESEEPDLLCWVAAGPSHAAPARPVPDGLPEVLRASTDRLDFVGIPSRLSATAADWPIIAAAAAAAEKETAGPKGEASPFSEPLRSPGASAATAAAVIRQRRSATRFDSRGTLSAESFATILDRTLPRGQAAPFEASFGAPKVNLLIFVHRVREVPSGLYLLARVPQALEKLKAACRKDFAWKPVHQSLPLWLLRAGDVTFDAMEASCHQEIAGESAFAVAMLADFKDQLDAGAWMYRQLHWECGMIGQVLYLEAEAQGVRGTGIGCFFDDAVHDLLGLRDNSFQDLYHFTIGHPVDDPRLISLPAYHHLKPV